MMERKWERISKKYSSPLRRADGDHGDENGNPNKFHMENCNFINEHQMRKMMLNENAAAGCGKDSKFNQNSNYLDPILVMNLRHESIRNENRNRKKVTVGESTQSIFNPLKVQKQMDHKKHNNLIEINLVNYEINKFNKKMNNLKTQQQQKQNQLTFDVQLMLKQQQENIRNNCDDHYEKLFGDGILLKHSNGIDNEIILNNNNNRHVNFNNSLEIIESIENSPRSINNCSISTVSSNSSLSSGAVSSSTPTTTTVLNTNNLNLKEINNQENPNSLSTALIDIDIINNKAHDHHHHHQQSALPLNDQNSLIITKLKTMNNKILNNTNNEKLIKSNLDDDLLLDANLNEKNQIIKDLFINKSSNELDYQNSTMAENCQRNKTNENFLLLKRYFLKWLHFISIQRLTFKHELQQNPITSSSMRIIGGGNQQNTNNNYTNKLQQIEYFLKHIRLEKKKCDQRNKNPKEFITTTSTTTTTTNQLINTKKVDHNHQMVETKKNQRRIKTQQNIIELQKLKLERQERLIQELRLMKILKENHDAGNEVKDELKNLYKTNGITQQSRTTAKCLHMYSNNNNVNGNDQLVAGALNNNDDDVVQTSPFEQLRATGLRIPKFLINMEARAVDRNLRHLKVQERREQLQREKEDARLAMEEAKRHQDEETKRQRIIELKKKRVQEKLNKLLKEKERLRQIENDKKSIEFYNLLLLRTFGLNRFRLLLKRKLMLERKAIAFHRNTLKKSMFMGWHLLTVKMNVNRIKLADDFYQKLIITKVFIIWKNYHLMEQSKYLVACDWYDLKLINQMFNNWMMVKNQRKLIEELKMKKAEAHFNWHLKWKSFDHWQRFKSVLRIEKDIEERRQRWRLKIWELLPDYTPNRE